MLVLVGEHDTRCVPGQVYRYVRALKKAGGDVELYLSTSRATASYVVDEGVREWAAVLGSSAPGPAARSLAPAAPRRTYTRPWSSIASATLTNPAMFAPFT